MYILSKVSVILRPHPNEMEHNVVMTGRSDSSLHCVPFGMTVSLDSVKTGNCHPERSEGSLVKTVIGSEAKNLIILVGQ